MQWARCPQSLKLVLAFCLYCSRFVVETSATISKSWFLNRMINIDISQQRMSTTRHRLTAHSQRLMRSATAQHQINQHGKVQTANSALPSLSTIDDVLAEIMEPHESSPISSGSRDHLCWKDIVPRGFGTFPSQCEDGYEKKSLWCAKAGKPPTALRCPSNKQKSGAFCYNPCPHEYLEGKGPVCWAKPPPRRDGNGNFVDCGAAAAEETQDCVKIVATTALASLNVLVEVATSVSDVVPESEGAAGVLKQVQSKVGKAQHLWDEVKEKEGFDVETSQRIEHLFRELNETENSTEKLSVTEQLAATMKNAMQAKSSFEYLPCSVLWIGQEIDRQAVPFESVGSGASVGNGDSGDTAYVEHDGATGTGDANIASVENASAPSIGKAGAASVGNTSSAVVENGNFASVGNAGAVSVDASNVSVFSAASQAHNASEWHDGARPKGPLDYGVFAIAMVVGALVH